MTEQKIKLYDVKNGKRAPAKRGTHFRSLQIYQCTVCHAKTNDWFYGGYPGWGLRHTCPAQPEFPKEHQDLEFLLDEREDLKGSIDAYTNESKKSRYLEKAASNVLTGLNSKLILTESKISELRGKLSEVSDIEGPDPDTAEIIDFYPSTKSFKSTKDMFKFNRRRSRPI